MKQVFIIISYLLLSTQGICQQAISDTIPQGTITADIDGVSKSFNYNAGAFAPADSSETGYYMIIGQQDSLRNTEHLSINVSGIGARGIRTYSNKSSKKTLTTTTVIYMQNDSTEYDNQYPSCNLAVSITSIHNGYIQGVFSGQLEGQKTINVSNGKFNVQLVRIKKERSKSQCFQ